jgi:hypothetical protein
METDCLRLIIIGSVGGAGVDSAISGEEAAGSGLSYKNVIMGNRGAPSILSAFSRMAVPRFFMADNNSSGQLGGPLWQ